MEASILISLSAFSFSLSLSAIILTLRSDPRRAYLLERVLLAVGEPFDLVDLTESALAY
jgi:hypothetical protein